MDKIDLQLWSLLDQRKRARSEALERGDADAAAHADEPIDVSVAFDGDAESLQALGFPVDSLVPDVARGALTPAQIRELVALPQVHLVSIPPLTRVLLDRSVPEINGVAAWGVGVGGAIDAARGKGHGVVVGVVDSGIDVFHGAFRNADGTSRILSLWDQTFRYNAAGVPVDGAAVPAPLTGDRLPKDETGAVLTRARAPTHFNAAFDYGAEFTTRQINAALTAHPDGDGLPVSLRDQPVTSGDTVVHHGTHVAGIAAGNGAQNDRCTSPFTYVGVAPEADLVIVKTGVGGGAPNAVSNLAHAVQYIFAAAAVPVPGGVLGRPCVVNLSLGSHFGPHNGQDFYSRTFDTLTTGALAVGRAIVIAAGNDRQLDLHAAFTIAHNTTQTVRVNLKVDSANELALFASYNPAAVLTCVVRMPRSGAVQQTAAQAVTAVNAAGPLGGHDVQVSVFPTTPADPDAHFFVDIKAHAGGNVTSGVWEFDLAAGTAGSDANVHLWVATPGGYNTAIVPFPGAVASVQDSSRDVKRPAEWIRATLSDLATCRRAITVAAYNAEEAGTPLAAFSAQGPAPNQLSAGLYDAANTIAKPDIAAPGVAIDAPRAEARRCCLECECCVDRYVAEQGTSMAAPHITGVVALMFARNPLLTTDEIKQRLQANFRNPPALPPGWPPLAELWGAGKVNAQTAVQASVREWVPGVVTETPPLTVPTPSILPVRWPDRLRGWHQLLGPRPAWNLVAALVSMHFDEVKRLIDTNRRVAAVWQRHGGPALVRNIVFADAPPNPPIPAEMSKSRPADLMVRFLSVLMRYGGDALRADIVRYGRLMQTLPGASWDELDAFVTKGGRQ